MEKFTGLVLLIVSHKLHRDDMLHELSELGIDAIAVETVEEAMEKINLDIWLVCFSTDGMKEFRAHDSDYLLEHTQKVRDGVGNPLFFVLDDCDHPIEAVEPITIVNSQINAPVLIKNLFDEGVAMKAIFENDRLIVWNSLDIDILEKPEKDLNDQKKELRNKLLSALQEGKWIAFEFDRGNEKTCVEWVSKMHRFGARNNLSFNLAVAFGDESKMRDHMSSIHLAHFGEAGAVTQYYDGSKTNFLEAVKVFDKEIQTADEKRVARKADISK